MYKPCEAKKQDDTDLFCLDASEFCRVNVTMQVVVEDLKIN